LENRNDIGGLWENFCIVERMKFNQYNNKFVNSYFWRTYQGEEIDYIEEYNGNLFAYEIKYKKDDVKFPKSFLDAYKNVKTQVVNKNNWTKFLIEVK
jgi:predicted AAA+ superfamily ATPase